MLRWKWLRGQRSSDRFEPLGDVPSVDVDPHVCESLSDASRRSVVGGQFFSTVGVDRRARLDLFSRSLGSTFTRCTSARTSTASRLDELGVREGGPWLLPGRRTGCRA
jgi:hypothetical protein